MYTITDIDIRAHHEGYDAKAYADAAGIPECPITISDLSEIPALVARWNAALAASGHGDKQMDEELEAPTVGTLYINDKDGTEMEAQPELDYDVYVTTGIVFSQSSAAAAALGRKGGQAKTAAKQTAARENGKKGGRPRGDLPKQICFDNSTGVWYPEHEYVQDECTRCGEEEPEESEE